MIQNILSKDTISVESFNSCWPVFVNYRFCKVSSVYNDPTLRFIVRQEILIRRYWGTDDILENLTSTNINNSTTKKKK